MWSYWRLAALRTLRVVNTRSTFNIILLGVYNEFYLYISCIYFVTLFFQGCVTALFDWFDDQMLIFVLVVSLVLLMQVFIVSRGTALRVNAWVKYLDERRHSG